MHGAAKGIAIWTVLSVASVQAFDPGHIPSDSWLTGHGFRHGDIEDALTPWIKARQNVTSGWDFKDGDVNQIYFGNWLRDYSQVIDTGSLKVFDANTLVTVVTVLGYLQFGSSSGPFQVNSERLGVYLPVGTNRSNTSTIHETTQTVKMLESTTLASALQSIPRSF